MIQIAIEANKTPMREAGGFLQSSIVDIGERHFLDNRKPALRRAHMIVRGWARHPAAETKVSPCLTLVSTVAFKPSLGN
jgi:hypothetical protein